MRKFTSLNLDHLHNCLTNCIVNILLLATTATPLEHLGNTITSDYDGTPPLYITKTRKDNRDYIYVNNAEILRSRSNIQTKNDSGKKQVRTIVDSFIFFFLLLTLSIVYVDRVEIDISDVKLICEF